MDAPGCLSPSPHHRTIPPLACDGRDERCLRRRAQACGTEPRRAVAYAGEASKDVDLAAQAAHLRMGGGEEEVC